MPVSSSCGFVGNLLFACYPTMQFVKIDSEPKIISHQYQVSIYVFLVILLYTEINPYLQTDCINQPQQLKNFYLLNVKITGTIPITLCHAPVLTVFVI